MAIKKATMCSVLLVLLVFASTNGPRFLGLLEPAIQAHVLLHHLGKEEIQQAVRRRGLRVRKVWHRVREPQLHLPQTQLGRVVGS
ncbi:hypothetical protein ACP4OV_023070 [Aristida adscensionis]